MKPVLAADLGGTRIKLGLVARGNLLATSTLPGSAAGGLRPLLPALEAGLRGLAAGAGLSPGDCAGLSLGFPGLVDPVRGAILSTSAKYDDARDLDLNAWARERLGLPAKVENDARLALLGEWRHGSGSGRDDLVLMTLGTGVGSAVLMGGKPLLGAHFQAGNLGGHFTINLEGSPCGCGNRGCVEAEASGGALARLPGSFPDYATVFRRAREGDAEARAARDLSLEAWAAGAVTLIHAYDPEILILGGGVMGSAEEVLAHIRMRVRERAWTPWGQVEVAAARHPDTAALLGGWELWA